MSFVQDYTQATPSHHYKISPKRMQSQLVMTPSPTPTKKRRGRPPNMATMIPDAQGYSTRFTSISTSNASTSSAAALRNGSPNFSSPLMRVGSKLKTPRKRQRSSDSTITPTSSIRSTNKEQIDFNQFSLPKTHAILQSVLGDDMGNINQLVTPPMQSHSHFPDVLEMTPNVNPSLLLSSPMTQVSDNLAQFISRTPRKPALKENKMEPCISLTVTSDGKAVIKEKLSFVKQVSYKTTTLTRNPMRPKKHNQSLKLGSDPLLGGFSNSDLLNMTSSSDDNDEDREKEDEIDARQALLRVFG
ncbi:Hypothetical protein PP7435_CHR1-1039 [Komagataella phaffii CBS 7435]|uniref:Uncharacterized protein n=2 Tax=Komagataella phaffii TaxID=460519 RepID=C4QXX0_KOMPG|nr:Hypothetical protein PAS_chr1-4_0260 [Komagataella phaffii GS115]AOA61520.1 GQ67_01918T0 [Komagataella phaffii]CAH2446911.1 Hypothetical protein BQ9382_C1-5470 [Komagataella phaffii CBS 7435]AOA66384.1 GQ68_01933T0 [Komagataella phaffii GS115]CAY68093.1 Hypothetical protein PAS_chr1-4_0260 [Komagataella phaffii GS115]CCA37169.1 Hypothetical protein PP7435_CHR1-1039 [Komagataella phaffii CBS 7435]